MGKPKSEKTAADPRSLDSLQQRYQALNTKKIQAETQLEAARNNLNTLKEQAREEYGTDVIEELEKQLDEMVRENERKKTEYQEHLDGIERALSDVEAKFSPPDGTPTSTTQ